MVGARTGKIPGVPLAVLALAVAGATTTTIPQAALVAEALTGRIALDVEVAEALAQIAAAAKSLSSRSGIS